MTTPVASLGILESSICATGHLGQCSHASMRRALVHSCLGNNRLVRSSSPPSPTTQSYAKRPRERPLVSRKQGTALVPLLYMKAIQGRGRLGLASSTCVTLRGTSRSLSKQTQRQAG